MDEDINKDLKDLSKHIHRVAREVGRKDIDALGLTAMSETLRLNAETIETYVRVQKDRHM